MGSFPAVPRNIHIPVLMPLSIAANSAYDLPLAACETTLESVAIFVDVQNIYYTTKERFSRHFDYGRFWAEVTFGRTVTQATAFAIDRNDEKQRRFQNILRGIGFDVKLKPFIRRADGSAKGDWDVGITMDILEHAPGVDVIVLASGDGDFDLLVRRVIDRHGVSVEVYGVPEHTAESLSRSASKFVAISERLLLGAGKI